MHPAQACLQPVDLVLPLLDHFLQLSDIVLQALDRPVKYPDTLVPFSVKLDCRGGNLLYRGSRVQVDEHLFEVLPQRFVRIVVYVCTLGGEMPVAVSHEHQERRWVPVADLAETFGGYRLPSGYLGAIRQAICQPPLPSLSPSTREV